MVEENSSVGKKVGFVAGKLLNLTKKGAKKLEDYANKSAAENNNENAKKLAEKMNKLSATIEENHDEYVAKVEQNADELVKLGQRTFDKMKKVYSEMKTRAEAAKEKAESDATPVENKEPKAVEEKVAAKKPVRKAKKDGEKA